MQSMGEEMPPEVIADSTSFTADELLRILVEHGGECTTRDFTRELGRPNDVISYHVNYHLIGNGLVEKVGVDETADFPNPPNKYRITERGRNVVDILIEQQEPTSESSGAGVDDATVEELRSEIAELNTTVEWLAERLDEHQEVIDKVDRRLS